MSALIEQIEQLKSLPMSGKFLQTMTTMMHPAHTHIAVGQAGIIYQIIQRDIARHHNLILAIEALSHQSLFDSVFGENHPQPRPDLYDIVNGYVTRNHSPDAITLSAFVDTVRRYGQRLAIHADTPEYDASVTQSAYNAMLHLTEQARKIKENENSCILRVTPYGAVNRIAFSYRFDKEALATACAALNLPIGWAYNAGSENPYTAMCNWIGN